MTNTTDIDVQELLERHRELEASLRLWIAANEVKDARLGALEAECTRLRHRVARLGRRAMQRERPRGRRVAHA